MRNKQKIVVDPRMNFEDGQHYFRCPNCKNHITIGGHLPNSECACGEWGMVAKLKPKEE